LSAKPTKRIRRRKIQLIGSILLIQTFKLKVLADGNIMPLIFQTT